MDYQRLLSKRNEENPFARELGIRTVEIRSGYARSELNIAERHLNFIGSVHGGCLFSLADTVCGSAAASHGFYCTTINGNINYLTAAIDVSRLIAEAREIKHGKRIDVYDVEIRDEKGTLLAQGTFSYFNLQEEIEL